MKELIEELDSALAILSTILLSHDAVDAMAAAKSKLRKVRVQLEKTGKEVNPDG